MIMKTIDYTTHGTCSRSIHIELDGHTVHNVSFLGGCPGNTVGVARLAEGREAEELIRLLKGIPCAGKTTSCPDQLARALEEAIAEE